MTQTNISKSIEDTKKCFRQKLYGPKREMVKLIFEKIEFLRLHKIIAISFNKIV